MTIKWVRGVMVGSTVLAFLNTVYFLSQQEYAWFGVAAVSLSLGFATCYYKTK